VVGLFTSPFKGEARRRIGVMHAIAISA